MKGKSELRVLLICQAFCSTLSIFFHEGSRILMRPYHASPDSDFGFSIETFGVYDTYYIGAPRQDRIGKVYTCPIEEDDIKSKRVLCNPVNIDVEALAKYDRGTSIPGANPDQHFFLGASITATSDYILVCAPLWATNYKSIWDTYGTCFTYEPDGSKVHRYYGTFEKYYNNKRIKYHASFRGGTGWRTFAHDFGTEDEKEFEKEGKGLIIIGKSTPFGDLVYTTFDTIQNSSHSLVNLKYSPFKKYFWDNNYENIGQSIVSGKFNSTGETIYAVSMRTNTTKGEVLFFTYKNRNLKLIGNFLKLTNDVVGSMFGAAMCGIDMNKDGMWELIVGAPAQADDHTGDEYGAIHIYLGGDLKNINDQERMRSILAYKEEARFGSTIAASDLDRDDFPEIFVSAPYEDSGVGAVYVLSGYEINKVLLKYDAYKQISLSELVYTQIIRESNFKTFGFSLKPVFGAGRELKYLTVGAPGNATALIYHAIPAVTINVTARLVEDTIKEQDSNFTVEVCLEVDCLLSCVLNNITITTSVTGNAVSIPKPRYVINDLDVVIDCKNTTVKFSDHEPGDYNFKVIANLENDDVLHAEDLPEKFAFLTPFSKMEASLFVTRSCQDEDCKPRLSAKIMWDHGSSTTYVLGSSKTQVVTVLVKNEGHRSEDSCIRVLVKGASIEKVEGEMTDNNYLCYLPKPLRRNTEHSMPIILDMSKSTNLATKLFVKVQLYENCQSYDYNTTEWEINYTLDTNDLFIVDSYPTNKTVTDTELLNENIKTISDRHEYSITNNGSVMWENVIVVVSTEKNKIIPESNFKVSATNNGKCDLQETEDRLTYSCSVALAPNATTKIVANLQILKDMFRSNLQNNELTISTQMVVNLTPTDKVLNKSLSTKLIYSKELSIWNKKPLIISLAILIAILVLAIVALVLYKMNFFKRKEKKKLLEYKESVRRASVKKSVSESLAKKSTTIEEECDDFDMEVLEDSPFDGYEPKSDTSPIVQQAQVHI